jgi:hypothetical protein
MNASFQRRAFQLTTGRGEDLRPGGSRRAARGRSASRVAARRLGAQGRKAQHALTFKRGANGAVFIPEVKHARGSLDPISVRVSRGVVLMLHYLKRHPRFDTDVDRGGFRCGSAAVRISHRRGRELRRRFLSACSTWFPALGLGASRSR